RWEVDDRRAQPPPPPGTLWAEYRAGDWVASPAPSGDGSGEVERPQSSYEGDQAGWADGDEGRSPFAEADVRQMGEVGEVEDEADWVGYEGARGNPLEFAVGDVGGRGQECFAENGGEWVGGATGIKRDGGAEAREAEEDYGLQPTVVQAEGNGQDAMGREWRDYDDLGTGGSAAELAASQWAEGDGGNHHENGDALLAPRHHVRHNVRSASPIRRELDADEGRFDDHNFRRATAPPVFKQQQQQQTRKKRRPMSRGREQQQRFNDDVRSPTPRGTNVGASTGFGSPPRQRMRMDPTNLTHDPATAPQPTHSSDAAAVAALAYHITYTAAGEDLSRPGTGTDTPVPPSTPNNGHDSTEPLDRLTASMELNRLRRLLSDSDRSVHLAGNRAALLEADLRAEVRRVEELRRSLQGERRRVEEVELLLRGEKARTAALEDELVGERRRCVELERRAGRMEQEGAFAAAERVRLEGRL
ncbi:hypothetical protein HK101_006538, partial [Irineochytrium annulatum]